MSEQIRQIVQVDDPIINNLVDTENKLNELNQEMVTILEDYQSVNTTAPSFFNFDNPYFLLTLVGLLMLVLALWFLKQELKHNKTEKNIKYSDKSKSETNVPPRITYSEDQTESVPKTHKKKKKSKGRKIKVIKVK